MTTYRSKIGLELAIPIAVLTCGTGLLMAYQQIWVGVVLILLLIAFIAHMLLTTYYQVDKITLRVKCGLFVDTEIDIHSIKEIKETNNPISSPAASLDRLIITYNKYDSVIISPEEKDIFINQLRGINPNVKLTLKGKAKGTISIV